MAKVSKRKIAEITGFTERHFHRLFDRKYVPVVWRHIPEDELYDFKASVFRDLKRGAWLYLNGSDRTKRDIQRMLDGTEDKYSRLFGLVEYGKESVWLFDNFSDEMLRKMWG